MKIVVCFADPSLGITQGKTDEVALLLQMSVLLVVSYVMSAATFLLSHLSACDIHLSLQHLMAFQINSA